MDGLPYRTVYLTLLCGQTVLNRYHPLSITRVQPYKLSSHLAVARSMMSSSRSAFPSLKRLWRAGPPQPIYHLTSTHPSDPSPPHLVSHGGKDRHSPSTTSPRPIHPTPPHLTSSHMAGRTTTAHLPPHLDPSTQPPPTSPCLTWLAGPPQPIYHLTSTRVQPLPHLTSSHTNLP